MGDFLFFCQKDENSELSGVWGKELFESDERKKKDERSERVFLPPIVLVLFLQKVHELDPETRYEDSESSSE